MLTIKCCYLACKYNSGAIPQFENFGSCNYEGEVELIGCGCGEGLDCTNFKYKDSIKKPMQKLERGEW